MTEPWDSGEHMAPDPSWPIEKRLKWHLTCSHILLLNCSERVRQAAAAEADRETADCPEHGLADAVTRLADEMAATAGWIAPVSSGPDQMPDMADEIRAEVLHEYAGRIRALVEPHPTAPRISEADVDKAMAATLGWCPGSTAIEDGGVTLYCEREAGHTGSHQAAPVAHRDRQEGDHTW